jgi:hypothetical protein
MSTASLVLGHKADSRVTEILHQVTESMHHSISQVISETESAAAEAREYHTVERWRKHLLTRISWAAAGAEFIPGVHGLGIAAELPYLFYLMGRGAIGTGALLGAEIDAEDDLRAVFALWSGAIPKSTLTAAQGGAVVVSYNGGALIINSLAHPAYGAKVLALGFEIGTKAAALDAGGAAGTIVGKGAGPLSHVLQPAFRKILVKISAKISAKVSAKLVAASVPLLGAAVSLTISRHVLNEFLASAKLYYEHKVQDTSAP